MKGEYYLGLDMGSGSVGWAVTNEKYEILRAHGKTLWGVRLFDSAQTAEERRGFRTAKRRLDRRNWRIELLQKIFAEEVEKIDDGFFRRMKESRYWPEDKRDRQGKCPELPYALFADDDYTDKEYHKQFPTIYHLRKWLMETDETPDIRLIYLALHHMMKHRGHFLLNGNIEQVREFQTTFEQFLEAVRAEELGFSSEIGVIEIKGIEHEKSFEIEITDSGTGMSEKQLAILRRKLRMRLNSDTQPKHGIGLRNVQDRIHIQFGTEYGLSVYTKEHCYTKVSIHLPITRGKYSLMDQEGDEKEEEKENEYTAGCRR